MPFARPALRMLATCLAASAALLAPAAQAENHALILWIGEYGRPDANLPGIDKDAALARQIALSMGVPAANIREVGNRALSKRGIDRELRELTARMAPDDKVFLYYSGHGGQVDGAGGAKCTEGMVSHDMDLFEDFRLQQALTELGRKASQVVMFNDSCFSGGAATKASRSLDAADPEAPRPKFYTGPLAPGAAVNSDQVCGQEVNKMSRNLKAVASNTERPPQVLYVAASAANEVSFATRRGSSGTLAWAACIGTADTDRSGAVNGEELRTCAQRWVRDRGFNQTITLVGNTQLPLTFVSSAAPASTGAAVNPARTLEDIRASADPAHAVSLRPSSSRLRIGQDPLDFSVSSNRAGYLYVLHVGSDGKTFDLLFPNAQDKNNHIPAGSHNFPRPNWRVKAGGPAGTSYLMAVVSPTPKNLEVGMDWSSMFAHSPATTSAARNLITEATGAGSGAGGGRFGASAVVPIQESH